MKGFLVSIVAVILAASLSPSARAAIVEYYVGLDERATIPSGTYAGLPDPNLGRLTLLYSHGDHYHARGIYSYTGPKDSATIVPTNVGNFLPETVGGTISLQPGTGALSGSFVTGLTPGVDYTNLRIRSVNSLDGFAAGSAESILFNSSGGRWNTPLEAGRSLYLNVVDITAGFRVVDANGATLLSKKGDTVLMGDAATLDFTPIFATNVPGAIGSLRFTITDGSGMPYPSSGQFVFNVSAVPEPSSMALVALVGSGLWGWRATRRRTPPSRHGKPVDA